MPSSTPTSTTTSTWGGAGGSADVRGGGVANQWTVPPSNGAAIQVLFSFATIPAALTLQTKHTLLLYKHDITNMTVIHNFMYTTLHPWLYHNFMYTALHNIHNIYDLPLMTLHIWLYIHKLAYMISYTWLYIHDLKYMTLHTWLQIHNFWALKSNASQ